MGGKGFILGGRGRGTRDGGRLVGGECPVGGLARLYFVGQPAGPPYKFLIRCASLHCWLFATLSVGPPASYLTGRRVRAICPSAFLVLLISSPVILSVVGVQASVIGDMRRRCGGFSSLGCGSLAGRAQT